MRPILRYHGGKWRIAPWIISHFPEHRIYVEPYGGAASVLLRKERAYAEVYNELDGEIVNVFRCMQYRGGQLKRLLKATSFSRREFLNAYKSGKANLERARKTIIKSFMGYGSDSIRRKSGRLWVMGLIRSGASQDSGMIQCEAEVHRHTIGRITLIVWIS